jgi:hypothetical protein
MLSSGAGATVRHHYGSRRKANPDWSHDVRLDGIAAVAEGGNPSSSCHRLSATSGCPDDQVVVHQGQLGHANPFASKSQPATMIFEQFKYAFVNSLPFAEQQSAFEKFFVPESRRIPAEFLTSTAHFDKQPGAPLLVIAGTNAHVITALLCRSIFAKHQRSGSVTYFKECPRRTHFILGPTNWEKVAEYVFSWIGGINYEHQNTPLPSVPSCAVNEL